MRIAVPFYYHVAAGDSTVPSALLSDEKVIVLRYEGAMLRIGEQRLKSIPNVAKKVNDPQWNR